MVPDYLLGPALVPHAMQNRRRQHPFLLPSFPTQVIGWIIFGLCVRIGWAAGDWILGKF